MRLFFTLARPAAIHAPANGRKISRAFRREAVSLSSPRAASSPRHRSDGSLAAQLRRELEGEVLFDAFNRGRYSTDASIYQIEPVGIVVPKTEEDATRAIEIAREYGVAVLSRGGGTSQIGQTVAAALVIDTSKYLNQVIALDPADRTVRVQPGIVLDELNRRLKPHGLFFPVDVSTASRATIGGMAGNNSCGSRSIRYGNMVHNVRAIDALLADGTRARFEKTGGDGGRAVDNVRYSEIVRRVRAVAARERDEIAARFPKVLRRVGGYNLDLLTVDAPNMAQLLVGSEGTLAYFHRIELLLQPIPAQRVLGVCHFPTFYQAMDTTQHVVTLDPSAVELVDRTMIDLSREIPLFRATVDRFVKGRPDALLLVEFSGDDRGPLLARMKQLDELMGTLGFPNAIVEVIEPEFQKAIWDVRTSGLNIMMSMKGDGKPVSFIEDCAVELKDLAEYTRRLTEVFHKHGTTGTWYAHASVGCLHVRPILNMKDAAGAKKMRAIAEEAFAMVREYKGSHSGEHGDGIARSEFHEPMFGSRLVRAFEEIKDTFDPSGVFNPGKIVHPPKMDDRRLFRYRPGYAPAPIDTALDWSEWGGFTRAVEMCNNNGACRKADPGVMCPSYRATRDEQHVTRGRANSLRLALTGQLGPDALASHDMYDTMALCIGCKGCKRECPTGVDMARMKTEFLHHYHKRHPLSVKERLVAYLPRYARRVGRGGFVPDLRHPTPGEARRAARGAPLLNLRDRIPGLPWLSERLIGFSARRRLPPWRSDFFDARREAQPTTAPSETDVVLLVDTFNTYFEPENARAAIAVLTAAGYNVHAALPNDGGRPLCCGRTFLAAGLIDEARAEARRLAQALRPAVDRGVAIVGLEPSCLLTLRDELGVLLPKSETGSIAAQALLFEEFLVRERERGRLRLALKRLPAKRAVLHGHCHQKAFGTLPAAEQLLRLIPELEVSTIEAGCCGMAGAFGFDAEHYDVSLKIGELGVLPAIRRADADALIVANGTSCRKQIEDAAGRQALHAVRLLERAL
jgi:FAD/FMN-containing dehydrogenase/Fe-S oxidoreductase